MSGVKYDSEKPMWNLLPLDTVEEIVKVMTFGCKKYGPDNWQTVKDGEDRYFAAAMRHITAHRSGEYLDKESGLPHMAHAACSVMFMLWIAMNRRKIGVQPVPRVVPPMMPPRPPPMIEDALHDCELSSVLRTLEQDLRPPQPPPQKWKRPPSIGQYPAPPEDTSDD